MSDVPITPDSGFPVVDIGDLRVARGMTRRPNSICRHKNMVVDHQERRIWCKDCERTVDAFDAFKSITEEFKRAVEAHNTKVKAFDEAISGLLFSRSAKALDNEWRKQKTVPCCPHCNEALLPEDFAWNRIQTASKELATLKRKAKEKQ